MDVWDSMASFECYLYRYSINQNAHIFLPSLHIGHPYFEFEYSASYSFYKFGLQRQSFLNGFLKYNLAI